MVSRRKPRVVLAVAVLGLLGFRHPVHSSSAEIVVPTGSAAATILLRAFADDFPAGTDSAAAARYLAERFRIVLRDGRRASIRLDRLRVDGPVVIATLTALVPGGLEGARVWHGVLTERFDDQINLVLARYGGRAIRLVFTSDDSDQPLP